MKKKKYAIFITQEKSDTGTRTITEEVGDLELRLELRKQILEELLDENNK